MVFTQGKFLGGIFTKTWKNESVTSRSLYEGVWWLNGLCIFSREYRWSVLSGCRHRESNHEQNSDFPRHLSVASYGKWWHYSQLPSTAGFPGNRSLGVTGASDLKNSSVTPFIFKGPVLDLCLAPAHMWSSCSSWELLLGCGWWQQRKFALGTFCWTWNCNGLQIKPMFLCLIRGRRSLASLSLSLQATQANNIRKYSVATVEIKVINKSNFPPYFEKGVYSGTVFVGLPQKSFVYQAGDPSTPLVITAMDQDFPDVRN